MEFEYAIKILTGEIQVADVPIMFRAKAQALVENQTELLEYARNKKWNEIKSTRDKLEESGCPFKDKMLDSDARSVIKINTMVEAAKQTGESFTIEWTMQDNSVLLLTYEDAISIPITLAVYSNSLHEQARLYREKIYSTNDIGEIMSIVWGNEKENDV